MHIRVRDTGAYAHMAMICTRRRIVPVLGGILGGARDVVAGAAERRVAQVATGQTSSGTPHLFAHASMEIFHHYTFDGGTFHDVSAICLPRYPTLYQGHSSSIRIISFAANRWGERAQARRRFCAVCETCRSRGLPALRAWTRATCTNGRSPWLVVRVLKLHPG